MKPAKLTAILLSTAIGFVASQTIASADEPGLATLMGRLQVYVQKLDLSVQNNNKQLIGFYLHELEESAEEIQDDIPSYDGFPVGQLTGSKLMPRIEALEHAVKNDADIELKMQALIDSCNECHEATDHGYIKINRMTSNPFNQSFE